MHDNQPHVKNVRLVQDTRSRAGAAGFDMRYGWVPAIALLIALYAVVTLFFD
jgi:hypothetical protein